jgi:NAD(P)-dependent dehydrogenase (short-subunit alcohol dehydrogenase family)
VHFRGKVAIVTGAASGIGRAIGEALAREGAIAILTDVDRDNVESVSAVLRGEGHTVSSERLDVTDAAAVQALVDRTVDQYGKLDFMFNNAGIGIGGKAHLFELTDWQPVLRVNLDGVIHGVVAAYRQMVRQGHGHIVNTASIAGLTPLPFGAAYAATKHAVVGLSTSLAVEAALHGVKVSAVCPGYIDTAIFGSGRYIGIEREKSLKGIPVKPTSPQDAAREILAGVEKGKVLIPVTRFAKIMWWLYRLMPEVAIKILSRNLRKQEL